MIVLDEQLLSYGVQASIAQWYRGAVTDITQLRHHTVILDEAIPMLLRIVSRPTFITINVADFWRRLAPVPGSASCVVLSLTPAPRKSPISCVVSWLWSNAALVAAGWARLCVSAINMSSTTQLTHEPYIALPGPGHRARGSRVERRSAPRYERLSGQ
jgi:hypothetical protein